MIRFGVFHRVCVGVATGSILGRHIQARDEISNQLEARKEKKPMIWSNSVAVRMVVKYVLDGGLGTLVQSRGAFQENGDDLWVSSCLTTENGRQELKKAHLDYLRAGADIIKTGSYQISVPLLKRSMPDITEVSSPPWITATVPSFLFLILNSRWSTRGSWSSFRAVWRAMSVMWQCWSCFRAASGQTVPVEGVQCGSDGQWYARMITQCSFGAMRERTAAERVQSDVSAIIKLLWDAESNLNTVPVQFPPPRVISPKILGAVSEQFQGNWRRMAERIYISRSLDGNIILLFVSGEMFGLNAPIGAYCTQRLSRISPNRRPSK